MEEYGKRSQEGEEPEPRLLGNAVCPWRTSPRSWK